jgi:hypothetical protein
MVEQHAKPIALVEQMRKMNLEKVTSAHEWLEG